MNAAQFELSEGDRARLRIIVATIDRELTGLSRAGTAEGQQAQRGLEASWAQLVGVLALGAAPEIRDCPTCHNVCMSAATRCGYCWTVLQPAPLFSASSQ